MSVKIFIKRKVAEANVLELTILLKQLRTLTINQPGYISGETLRRIDKNNECMAWRKNRIRSIRRLIKKVFILFFKQNHFHNGLLCSLYCIVHMSGG